MAKKKLFDVYSSMLGGFIAMGFETEDEARKFIAEYDDRIEAKGMSITKG